MWNTGGVDVLTSVADGLVLAALWQFTSKTVSSTC